MGSETVLVGTIGRPKLVTYLTHVKNEKRDVFHCTIDVRWYREALPQEFAVILMESLKLAFDNAEEEAMKEKAQDHTS